MHSPVPYLPELDHWSKGAVLDLYQRAYEQQWRPLEISTAELTERWSCSWRRAWGLLRRLEELELLRLEVGKGRTRTTVLVHCPGRKRRGRRRRKNAGSKGQGSNGRIHPSGKRSRSSQGIDVALHFLDIRKITIAKHAADARAAGLDPDDLVAKVVERIMVANVGSSPFDASKGRLSAYIYRQGRSALLNMSDQEARRRAREVLGEEQDATV